MCFHFCVLPGGNSPPVGWGSSVVITCLDNRRTTRGRTFVRQRSLREEGRFMKT